MLTGVIPSQLGEMKSLHYLYLKDNNFTNATIPSQVLKLPLHVLDVVDGEKWLAANLPGCITIDLASHYVTIPVYIQEWVRLNWHRVYSDVWAKPHYNTKGNNGALETKT